MIISFMIHCNITQQFLCHLVVRIVIALLSFLKISGLKKIHNLTSDSGQFTSGTISVVFVIKCKHITKPKV